MIIDRNNYEEFFILYWDDELDAGQKKAVEEFVNLYSDLQQEFRLLGNTRFSAEEEIKFDNKQMLLKEEHSILDNSILEEYMLSYVDGELNDEEKKTLEKYISTDPLLRIEISMLQKVKLQPEHIVFPDKSVLYRKEDRRVVSMVWFRLAVAAAILIIAGLFTFRLINTGKTSGGEAPVVAKQTEAPLKNNVPAVNDKEDKKLTNEQDYLTEVKKQQEDAIKAKKLTSADNNQHLATIKKSIPEKIKKSSITPQENNLPVQQDDNAIVMNDLEAIISHVNKTATDVSKPLSPDDVTSRTSPTFEFIETSEGKSDVVKDGGGLKGLLRKATRVFEKRTNIQTTTEDNKLLIGAFALSLK